MNRILLTITKLHDKEQIKAELCKSASYDDLIKVILELLDIVKNNTVEEKVKLSVPSDIINELHKMIDDNFRVISSNGRGRKAIYEDWEYDKQVAYIVKNAEMPKRLKQDRLRKIYEIEKAKRISNNEDISNFEMINIYKIDIENFKTDYTFD